MRRFRRIAPALLPASLVLLLTGCQLFGTAPEPLPPPAPAVLVDDPPKTLFAGVSDLPLLAGPEATADKLASLAMNEELIRYKTFQDFAYVEVRDTGTTGWVDNGLLLERTAAPKPLPAGEDIPPEDPFDGALPGPEPGQGPISETF